VVEEKLDRLLGYRTAMNPDPDIFFDRIIEAAFASGNPGPR
jgi:hypothetical protein